LNRPWPSFAFFYFFFRESWWQVWRVR
jgi:hypothetical protein